MKTATVIVCLLFLSLEIHSIGHDFGTHLSFEKTIIIDQTCSICFVLKQLCADGGFNETPIGLFFDFDEKVIKVDSSIYIKEVQNAHYSRAPPRIS